MVKKRHAIALVGIAVLFAIVIVGCSSDEKEQASSSASSTTSQPSGSSSGSQSPAGNAGGGSDASGRLTDLLKKAGNSQYQVKYDFKSSEGAGGVGDGTMTLAFKGNKSSVTVSATGLAQPGVKTDITFIDDGQNTYICGAFLGAISGTGNDPACLKSSNSSGGLGTQLFNPDSFDAQSLSESLAEGSSSIQSDGSETIAGRSADCFKAQGTTGHGRICVDKDSGAPLLFDDGSTSLKATSTSQSVSDSVFQPPYKVVEAPAIP